MYATYYEQGDKFPFDDLGELLSEHGIATTSSALLDLTDRMKRLHIGDMLKAPDDQLVIYSWNMSSVWGSNGIVYDDSGDPDNPALERFPLTEPLESGFYYYAR